ncbi:MAG: hypothetical protein KDC48_08135, partial [Planctomycetes bacterium]|nr:hypothetical protein [Planctomycetota bacterium]
MTRSLFASLLTCGLLLTPAAAQRPGAGGRPAAPEKPPALGQAATGRIVYSYENAGHWAMRAILLLSLGTDWHPDGLSIVRAALADKDDRLPPFAIETLLAADDRVIAAMATPETIAALIDALRSKNELVRTRLELLLHRLAPAATCSGRTEWQRWWRDAQDDWRPATWTPIEGAPTGGTSTQKVIER